MAVNCGTISDMQSDNVRISGASLKNNFPDVAAQWHPTKNGNKKPENFTPGSTEKVHWRCERGHEWEAVIKDRSGWDWLPGMCNRSKRAFLSNFASSYYGNISMNKNGGSGGI